MENKIDGITSSYFHQPESLKDTKTDITDLRTQYETKRFGRKLDLSLVGLNDANKRANELFQRIQELDSWLDYGICEEEDYIVREELVKEYAKERQAETTIKSYLSASGMILEENVKTNNDKTTYVDGYVFAGMRKKDNTTNLTQPNKSEAYFRSPTPNDLQEQVGINNEINQELSSTSSKHKR